MKRLILGACVLVACREPTIPSCGPGGEWDEASERCVCVDGWLLDEDARQCVMGDGGMGDGGMPDAFTPLPEDAGVDAFVPDGCVLSTYYRDADEDGRGDPADSREACTEPEGYVADATDCDDDCDTCWTDAEETCDTEDNDCDGHTDEGVTTFGDEVLLTTDSPALPSILTPRLFTVELGTGRVWLLWERAADGEFVTSVVDPGDPSTIVTQPLGGSGAYLPQVTVTDTLIAVALASVSGGEEVVFARGFSREDGSPSTPLREVHRAASDFYALAPFPVPLGEGFGVFWTAEDGSLVGTSTIADLRPTGLTDPIVYAAPDESRTLLSALAAADGDAILFARTEGDTEWTLDARVVNEDGPVGGWTTLTGFDNTFGGGAFADEGRLVFMANVRRTPSSDDGFELRLADFSRVGSTLSLTSETVLDSRMGLYFPFAWLGNDARILLSYRLGATSASIVRYADDASRTTVAPIAGVGAPTVTDRGAYYFSGVAEDGRSNLAFRPFVCE